MEELYGYVLMDTYSNIICLSQTTNDFLKLLEIKRRLTKLKINTQLIDIPKSIYNDIANAFLESETTDTAENTKQYHFVTDIDELTTIHQNPIKKLFKIFN